MPYRLRYAAWIDFVPAGLGPMGGALAPLSGPVGGSGLAQTKEFLNAQGGQNQAGSGAGGIIQAADITALLTAMTTDLSAQMNAGIGQLQGFVTGGG